MLVASIDTQQEQKDYIKENFELQDIFRHNISCVWNFL